LDNWITRSAEFNADKKPLVYAEHNKQAISS